MGGGWSGPFFRPSNSRQFRAASVFSIGASLMALERAAGGLRFPDLAETAAPEVSDKRVPFNRRGARIDP